MTKNIVIALLVGLLAGQWAGAQPMSVKNGGMGITVNLSDSNMARLERAIIITGLASNPEIVMQHGGAAHPERILQLAKDLGY